MNVTTPSAEVTPALGKGYLAVLADLTKARLTTLVLLTTLVGYYVGQTGSLEIGRLFHLLLGTGLVAAGASALNQLIECEYDARMRRTAGRPLPSGRMQPETVLWFGVVCSVLGLGYLAWLVNWLTSCVGAVTLASYLFVYTPLKRVTWMNTLVGAIPGALPPVMGWTAARGELSAGGWLLFAILFFWQLPHFFAIAWLYREEYERAGFVMLPAVDVSGLRTARQSLVAGALLLAVSFGPAWLGLTGQLYPLGAAVLGGAFWAATWRFSRNRTAELARLVFFASILYLPLLLGLMVVDRTK